MSEQVFESVLHLDLMSQPADESVLHLQYAFYSGSYTVITQSHHSQVSVSPIATQWVTEDMSMVLKSAAF